MKKYKKESTLEKMTGKYRLVYFFSYTFGFLLLSIVVGAILFVILSSLFIKNHQNTIDTYIKQYQSFDFNEGEGNKSNPGITSGSIEIPRIMDLSMSAVVFYTDANGEIMEYNIIGADYNEDYYSAVEEDFGIERDEDKFIVTVINGEYYLTELVRITNPFYEKENLIGYVKVYNNIDAEFTLRGKVISIYSFLCAIAFVASLGLGLIIMYEGVRPLKIFIEKQTNFVSDASHELRTPLAVVQSKIETILSQPDKTVCDVSEDLAIALNEINRLTKLTSELLTLARNDKDNIEINYSVFDCNEALEELTEPFVEIAQLAGKKLTYEGTPCLVKLDKDKLKQVMIINIDNALKYTEEGDEINISLKTIKDEVLIEIADTGIGLSDESKKKVFERFYRADKARSRETGGNGLGLSIAYTLIKLQKGNIEVYDNEPKGTKFIIRFAKVKDKEANKNYLESLD